MDNSTLVFIVFIETIIIVWQASKLTQYHKVERILAGQTIRLTDGSAPQDSAASAPSTPAINQESPAARADSASRAVATAISAKDGANDSADDIDEQILDVAGVDPESNIEEAKRVQLVMARCRYAEFYLEQLDDDYERGQFQRIINSCKATARNIQDPFFRASALQPVILLLHRADWGAERDELLAEVDDKLMRQRISEELESGTETPA